MKLKFPNVKKAEYVLYANSHNLDEDLTKTTRTKKIIYGHLWVILPLWPNHRSYVIFNNNIIQFFSY